MKEKGEIELKGILTFAKSCLIFWQPRTAGGYSQKWVGRHHGTPFEANLQKINHTRVQNWEYLTNVRSPKYTWDKGRHLCIVENIENIDTEFGTKIYFSAFFFHKKREIWDHLFGIVLHLCVKFFASLPQAGQVPRNLYETPKWSLPTSLYDDDSGGRWRWIRWQRNQWLIEWLIEINYSVFGGDVILRFINIQLLCLLRRGYEINAFHIWEDLPTKKPDHSFSAAGCVAKSFQVWRKYHIKPCCEIHTLPEPSISKNLPIIPKPHSQVPHNC